MKAPNPKPKTTKPKAKKSAAPKRSRKVANKFSTNSQLQRFTVERPNRVSQDAFTIVENDEFIQTVITAGSNFSIAAEKPINPGMSPTFPWLAPVALKYNKYVFRSLEFYYKPMVTQFSAGENTGKVMLMVNYDASDSAPVDRRGLENTVPHQDGMPYQSLSLKLSPKQMHTDAIAKYIRGNVPPGGSDIKTYDIGTFYIATEGQQNPNVAIGELRVKYTVALSVPIQLGFTSIPKNNRVAQLNFNSKYQGSSATWQDIGYDNILNNGLNLTLNSDGACLISAGGTYLIVTRMEFGNTDAVFGNCAGRIRYGDSTGTQFTDAAQWLAQTGQTTKLAMTDNYFIPLAAGSTFIRQSFMTYSGLFDATDLSCWTTIMLV